MNFPTKIAFKSPYRLLYYLQFNAKQKFNEIFFWNILNLDTEK